MLQNNSVRTSIHDQIEPYKHVNPLSCLPQNSAFFLFCFILRHTNLVGHLMPNQVIENKSEKKFKGEVLGINDEL